MSNPYQCLKEYEGQYIKYPQLCDLIGEDKRGGNAKKSHLSRISKYVDLAQNKGKIYIHKVYDTDDELQIIESHGKFTSYIKQFLINALADLRNTTNNDYIILTNRDILEMTYMVNHHYFIGRNAPAKYIEQFDLPTNSHDLLGKRYLFDKVYDATDIFFSSSYRLLKRVVYDSLTSLEKMSLIQKNKTFRLYKNGVDDNGRFESINKNCDESETGRILTVQHKSVVEFNEQVSVDSNGKKKYFLKNIQSVHYLYPSQRREFYKILNDNLKEEFKDEGWNAYSVAWKINLAKTESFDYEVEKISYKQLNKNVQDKLLNAKDLNLIETALKEQFVNTFIRV